MLHWSCGGDDTLSRQRSKVCMDLLFDSYPILRSGQYLAIEEWLARASNV